MKNIISWLLSVFIAFIFAQSLLFKFSGATETVIIFATIADWMASIGFASLLSNLFAQYGAYAVGTVELIEVVLVLLPKTRLAGALLSLAVISSAIFIHLFTPLGIDRMVDLAGNTDGGALFYTACAVALSSLMLLVVTLSIGGKRKVNQSIFGNGIEAI